MTREPSASLKVPFRPRARLLQLLGDELIGSPRLAVFELVKNAYDACARTVRVRLNDLETEEPWIEIEDDGQGMDLATIRDIWLVPGHDHRKLQRQGGIRSSCGRLPLGEKGVGRFAVHKLGERISLVTRAQGEPENVVEIDWELLTSTELLSDAPVEVQTREPQIFRENATGTRIEIRSLRPPAWTRGEVRRLHRQITSICSPFQSPNDFFVDFEVPGWESWTKELYRVEDLIKLAHWSFRFSFDGSDYSWQYEFHPQGLPLTGRVANRTGDVLLVPEERSFELGERLGGKKQSVRASPAYLGGIGPLKGEFYVYDRDKEVLQGRPESQMLKDFLDLQGGVRVYRDGIRVYNYGEPGDDWLGLDLRRVQTPTVKLSRNLILGVIHLSLENSSGLIEKTNREGFVENEAFRNLQRLVLGALATLEQERYPDKDRIRRLVAKDRSEDRHGIKAPLAALRKELRKEPGGVYDRCERHLATVEHRYLEMQESLLQPAMSGLNLALLFHEVERGVRELLQAVKNRVSPEQLERQARDMAQMLGDFSKLLRQDEKKKQPIAKMVDHLRRILMSRFRFHRVTLECEVSMDSNPGFDAAFSFGLVLGALSNLIDNSLYWLRVRWPDEPVSWENSPRRIRIQVSRDLEGGPCLVVADTGPGFRDVPEDMVRPFFTRKPDGMGLGLYFAHLVMELAGGRLLFPSREDVGVPEEFDGAVIALQFPEVR